MVEDGRGRGRVESYIEEEERREELVEMEGSALEVLTRT